MGKPREDRAYGGKAGIWLKKRRTQANVHPANDDEKKRNSSLCVPQTKVTPPSSTTTSTLMTKTKKNNSDKAQNPPPSKKQVLVGWDDERCRPIYRETAASSSETTSTASTVDCTDDDSEDGNENVEQERSMEEPASSVLVTSTNTTEMMKKTRAYGSRKRVASLSSCHDMMDTQHQKRPHVTFTKKSAAASITTPSTNSRLTFDLETPQTAGLGSDNICDALNSETKAAPLDASHDSTVAFKTARPAKKEKDEKNVNVARKQTSTKQQPKLPVLAHFDFKDDELVGQPSSTTSLAAARAFFQRLDANQTLTLDSSHTPEAAQGRNNPCVRTRRAISVEGNDGLQREYRDYVTATRATSVEPLSLEQYARNRSAFFRRGDMYDGFLNG